MARRSTLALGSEMSIILLAITGLLFAVLLGWRFRGWLWRKRKGVTLVLTLFALAGMGAFTWGWYYDRYVWPDRIQRELLGRVIVERNALAEFEGGAAFGQGMFRWTYKAPLPANLLPEYCGSQPVRSCRFEKHGSPESQVETYLIFDKGKLVLEEWWF
jgi:hypothetical protein